MAAGKDPLFVTTPKSPSCRASVANTNRDGSTGTYETLFTAGSNGSFFQAFRWCAEATTTAGFIRLFVQKGGSGNVELMYEAPVAATTPTAGTTPTAQGDWYPPGGITLDAGAVVKVNTHIGEAIGCFLLGGGDY